MKSNTLGFIGLVAIVNVSVHAGPPHFVNPTHNFHCFDAGTGSIQDITRCFRNAPPPEYTLPPVLGVNAGSAQTGLGTPFAFIASALLGGVTVATASSGNQAPSSQSDSSWGGFGFDAAQTVAWSRYEFGAAQAYEWRQHGFDAVQAYEWRQRGFDAVQAYEWRQRAFDAGQAYIWRQRGLSAEQSYQRRQSGSSSR